MPKRKSNGRPDPDDFSFLFHEIDETDLIKEWGKQPKAVWEIGLLAKTASRTLSEAKANLEVVKAEISKDVRENPEVYGIEKITEKVVETTVIQQQSYNNSLTEVFNAREDLDIFQAALNALEHKKRSLEAHVSLHGQGYFATPQAKQGDSQEWLDEKKKKLARKRANKRRRDD